MNRINGQSYEFDGNGQFNANVPADFDRRLQNVQVTHPEALVATAPAKREELNVDWRSEPIDKTAQKVLKDGKERNDREIEANKPKPPKNPPQFFR